MSKTDTVKKRKERRRFDAEDYVNIQTAESLDSELNKATAMYMEVETCEWVFTFKDFVSSDAVFDEKISWLLSAVDYRRYRLMSNWLHTPFNVVLSGNNRPHTLQTLSQAIRLSVDETTRFVKRLAAMGVLVYSSCPESGYDKKIFMMNPYVIRKRKSFHEKLLEIFTDIRHAKLQAKTISTTARKEASQLQAGQMN